MSVNQAIKILFPEVDCSEKVFFRCIHCNASKKISSIFQMKEFIMGYCGCKHAIKKTRTGKVRFRRSVS